jgi:hypothetical protein
MPFVKGQSGNPAGRPARTDTEKALRERIRQAAPGVADALIESAQAGDVTAGRTLLAYVMAPYKATDAPVPLAFGDGSTDLSTVATAVLVGLGAGSLSPDQAGAVAGVVSALARIEETVTLAARVAALEARNETASDPH